MLEKSSFDFVDILHKQNLKRKLDIDYHSNKKIKQIEDNSEKHSTIYHEMKRDVDVLNIVI